MSRTKVWMSWWNTCPTHRATPREYQQGVKTLFRCSYSEIISHHGCLLCINSLGLKWRVLKMVAPSQIEESQQRGQWKTWPGAPAALTHMGWPELLVHWLWGKKLHTWKAYCGAACMTNSAPDPEMFCELYEPSACTVAHIVRKQSHVGEKWRDGGILQYHRGDQVPCHFVELC